MSEAAYPVVIHVRARDGLDALPPTVREELRERVTAVSETREPHVEAVREAAAARRHRRRPLRHPCRGRPRHLHAGQAPAPGAARGQAARCLRPATDRDGTAARRGRWCPMMSASRWYALGRWYGLLRWSVGRGSSPLEAFKIVVAAEVIARVADDIAEVTERVLSRARRDRAGPPPLPPAKAAELRMPVVYPVRRVDKPAPWPPFTGVRVELGGDPA